MAEELPEGMKERGTHLHHEVEPVMPEMFGEEKGARQRFTPAKRTVMSALGVKKVGEIDPAIEKIESKPLKEALLRQKLIPEQEIKTPEGRDKQLKRNELLRTLIISGDLTPEEEKVAKRFIRSIGRLIEKTGEPEKSPEAAERLTTAEEKMISELEKIREAGERREVVLKLRPEEETPLGWTKMIIDNWFALEKVTSEEMQEIDKKDFDFKTILSGLREVPAKEGIPHPKLSNFLEREYPEGVYLKERLELVVEALRRLHNRKVEVLEAEGGLAKLGAVKAESALKPELEVAVANLRPRDWYVLSHLDDLFPEFDEIKSNKELAFPVDEAIKIWKQIRKQRIIDGNQERAEGYPCSLKEVLQSERYMARLRAEIAKRVKSQRAEQVAFDILTAALSFPCWDRLRWKQKGKQEDRDLMWFDWKRVLRFRQMRPCGPHDTVGNFWAYEEQDDDEILERNIPDEQERAKRKKILVRNKNRAIFKHHQAGRVPDGTILGDFFSSTAVKDKMRGREVLRRLSDYPSLKEIPWLDPDRFLLEEEMYAGYFGYSIPIAAGIVEVIRQSDWKPEDLMTIKMWERLADLTVRLPHFSPAFNSPVLMRKAIEVARQDPRLNERRALLLVQNELIMRFRRALARGILWAGSYLAQPEPGLTGRGAFSRGEVYGGFGEKGILDAMGAAGFLNKEHLDRLYSEIEEFKFHTRGRGGALDILIRGRRATR